MGSSVRRSGIGFLNRQGTFLAMGQPNVDSAFGSNDDQIFFLFGISLCRVANGSRHNPVRRRVDHGALSVVLGALFSAGRIGLR